MQHSVSTLLICCALSACSSTQGTVKGAESSPSFVRSTEVVWFETERGLARMRMDGTDQRVIFPSNLHIDAMSMDGQLVAFRDDRTRLYVGTTRDGKVQQVQELGNMAGTTAFSPDGRKLAVSLHANFAQPQEQWSDTDAVYLVDTATMQVSLVPEGSKTMVIGLGWSDDSRALWVTLQGSTFQRIDAASGAREKNLTRPENVLFRSIHLATGVCAATGVKLVPRGERGADGLDLIEPGAQPRPLVLITPAKEFGGMDVVSHPAFSKSCEYGVFGFDSRIWVVEISSGKTAQIAEGWHPFTVPTKQ